MGTCTDSLVGLDFTELSLPQDKIVKAVERALYQVVGDFQYCATSSLRRQAYAIQSEEKFALCLHWFRIIKAYVFFSNVSKLQTVNHAKTSNFQLMTEDVAPKRNPTEFLKKQ